MLQIDSYEVIIHIEIINYKLLVNINTNGFDEFFELLYIIWNYWFPTYIITHSEFGVKMRMTAENRAWRPE